MMQRGLFSLLGSTLRRRLKTLKNLIERVRAEGFISFDVVKRFGFLIVLVAVFGAFARSRRQELAASFTRVIQKGNVSPDPVVIQGLVEDFLDGRVDMSGKLINPASASQS